MISSEWWEGYRLCALLCFVHEALWDGLNRSSHRAALEEKFTTIDFIPLENHNSICSVEANKRDVALGLSGLQAQPKWYQVIVSLINKLSNTNWGFD